MSSIYPLSVQPPISARGPYVGFDVLTGGAGFHWDPFEFYDAGLATNPNCWILGEPGFGKSALVKTLLWRMTALYGAGPTGRWIAIADPKGEYLGLGDSLGLTVIRLAPGGPTTINPLAPGPAGAHEPPERRVLRQADMLTALVATVLGRPLGQVEDAALFAAVEHLTHLAHSTEVTLHHVAELLATPPAELTDRLTRNGADLHRELTVLAIAVDKLLTRSLRGMFDGPSNVTIDWEGPGILLDLSAIPLESEALPLVMVAAAGWLQQIMACPGPQRVQVLDEAWALLRNKDTASYLQGCFKLGRSYGVANVCITHRASDLSAQADDGTATAKIATGLVSDSATRIILRQAPDQVSEAARVFGLNGPETEIVGQTIRGRALWKIAGRTALVQHVLAPTELPICDTDARMRADPGGTANSPNPL